jgi:probable DNA metabolism protein
VTSVIYIYDGSFEGLLSLCRFLILNNEIPADIVSEVKEKKQEGLFDVKLFMETDTGRYEEMKKMIAEKISKDSLDGISCAFLSENDGIELNIYSYIIFGLEKGRDADKYMSDPEFIPVYQAYRQVSREADRFKGFLRFEEIEPGILYAEFEPDHNIIMMVASHFKHRLSGLSWIIHDRKRGTAVFFDTKKCVMKQALDIEFREGDNEKISYGAMWSSYFEAMGIKERKNYRLQRQLVPKKYRKNMTEFKIKRKNAG